ncbi:MAG TPA: SIR2 family protein [Methanoregulaceae archaeon]|nr:SIR2 family protein [Methanoregulaceae archaeon]HQN88473.1 SIR2 family protein [Methanoregulaceae archaeon]HQP82065.1 SIR2 family protein [Methanoregulaceae archaeon]
MSEIQPTINPSLPLLDSQLDRLCRLIREEKVILWVGSGFSSYAGYPTGKQLKEIMLSSIGDLLDDAPDPAITSLQEAADYYVEQKGRDGLNAFVVEQYGKEPSRCDIHETLALINRVKYVVTTNYDPLFERAYGDKIVVISRDEHLPASTEYPDKTVLLKIHGDISRPDSIVITSDDYDRFDADTIVWSKIRSLLAEYSVMFIGYSLQDPNVEKMLRDIYARVGKNKHPYYFIGRTVDENKREALASFDLDFIEMDAASAIEYISGNVIQFSLVSSFQRTDLFQKSDDIFADRGFQVDRAFTKGKLSRATIIPNRPDIQANFTLTLASKEKTGLKIRELDNFVKGLGCDPITIGSDDCIIEIHDANINGVLFIDPSMRILREISLKPKPVNKLLVDLQSSRRQLRLNNLKMKVFGTPKLSKFEIDDVDFKLTMRMSNESPGGELNFKIHHIVPDIDRARILYGLLDALMCNETIELISSAIPKPFHIKANFQHLPEDSPSIKGLYLLYSDLLEIQHKLGVKCNVPDEISDVERRKIRGVANFLRGCPQIIDDVTITVENTEKVREIYSKGEGGVFRLTGEMRFHETIFGQTLEIPFEVEGFDTWPINTEDVDAAIARRDEDLVIKLKSSTNRLFRKFSAASDNSCSATMDQEAHR